MINGRILLKPLTMADANSFYALYKNPEVNHGREPFLPDESPLEFTSRIIAACVEIFTIRLAEEAETVIGDCALHDPDDERQEMEIGGSLLPAFQGKGYMREAFRWLEQRAKEHHRMQRLISKTELRNKSAIRLMETLGYLKCSEEKDLITFSKSLDTSF